MADYSSVYIMCEKLERLSMIRRPLTGQPLVELPWELNFTFFINLMSMELDGFAFILPHLPCGLSALPYLEVLEISCCHETVTQVLLRHKKIYNVVLRLCRNEGSWVRDNSVDSFELTLLMPSLLRVDMRESSVKDLKVEELEKVVVIVGCDVNVSRV